MFANGTTMVQHVSKWYNNAKQEKSSLAEEGHNYSRCQTVFVMQVVSTQLVLTHAACVWTDSNARPQRRMLAQCEFLSTLSQASISPSNLNVRSLSIMQLQRPASDPAWSCPAMPAHLSWPTISKPDNVKELGRGLCQSCAAWSASDHLCGQYLLHARNFPMLCIHMASFHRQDLVIPLDKVKSMQVMLASMLG